MNPDSLRDFVVENVNARRAKFEASKNMLMQITNEALHAMQTTNLISGNSN